MFIGEKIIYFELQKTGSTHVKQILQKNPYIKGFSYGKHNAPYEVPARYLKAFHHKMKVGNVRNPWDWYVSLWAFGCMEKGGLYNRTTKKPTLSRPLNLAKVIKHPNRITKPAHKWKYAYSDVNNPGLFKYWLGLLFTKSRQKDFREGYHRFPLSHKLGLLTYRYLSLYTSRFHLYGKKLDTINDIFNYDHTHNHIDFIIQLENMEQQPFTLFKSLGLPEASIKEAIAQSGIKTNKSARRPYQEYYDQETFDLILNREHFIIQKYGYEFG